MSVITSRSSTTVLSILKSRKDGRLSNHRVRFQLPNNVRKIFIDLKTGVSSKDYEALVCTIRDSEISDGDLLKLLEEAKNCIALLDYDLRLFVQALLILGWTHRSQQVVQCYQEFINNLVSAHSQHAKVVTDQLVKLFSICEENDWDDDRLSPQAEQQFSNIHAVLKSIVRTIPLTENMLLAAVKNNVPYIRQSSHKQLAYFHNTLRIIEYLPQCRREILTILVDRLLTLDVNAPREIVLEPAVDDIFVMDQPQPYIDSLDGGMLMMFRYLDSTCRPGGEVRWNEAKTMFADFMEVLDKVLLSAHGCHHVQFLLFYLVSFKTTLTQGFLNSLWQKVLTPSVPPIVRKMAVAYIASFLSRASFIPTGFLKTYLSEMSSWLHRYVVTQDESKTHATSMHAHGVFYAVCQAVFYVIAFRHKDLVDSRKKLVFLQSLNLSKLVTCPLNPLLVCSPAVVENFAAVARDYQLAYCYTVIDQNTRSFLNAPSVDDFFPFDPYVLKKSSSVITPLYNEYCSEIEDDDIAERGTASDLLEERGKEEEEDDFIADGKKIEKLLHDISYSTSPGFKPMSV